MVNFANADMVGQSAVIGPERQTYPDPVDHCGVCRWRDVCVARRRADDHLSLVAGMRRDVTRRLVDQGVSTVVGLAEMPEVEVERGGRGVLGRRTRLRPSSSSASARRAGRDYELPAPAGPGPP